MRGTNSIRLGLSETVACAEAGCHMPLILTTAQVREIKIPRKKGVVLWIRFSLSCCLAFRSLPNLSNGSFLRGRVPRYMHSESRRIRNITTVVLLWIAHLASTTRLFHQIRHKPWPPSNCNKGKNVSHASSLLAALLKKHSAAPAVPKSCALRDPNEVRTTYVSLETKEAMWQLDTRVASGSLRVTQSGLHPQNSTAQ